MRFRRLKIAAAVACMLAGLYLVYGRRAESSHILATYAPAPQVEEIDGYRSWTKVNQTPKLMPGHVARDCVLWISPKGRLVDGPENPHREKYFTVYVNEVGRKAMFAQKGSKFPEGSVIVKEKLPSAESFSPELLTVMIKRKKGFNPESDDWEYMVTDGAGTKIEGRGALQNCQGCHIAVKAKDYVFRTYLPQ